MSLKIEDYALISDCHCVPVIALTPRGDRTCP